VAETGVKLPLQIAFRGMDTSEAVEARIRERAEGLERYDDRIVACRVVVERAHGHHRHGNHYHVRVDLTVPDAELVAGREPDEHHRYEDVYVAIRDAFDAVRRQLEDHVRRRRGAVKLHETPRHGRVVALYPDHGRIENADGVLVYFHRNSVVDADFSRLDIGTEVRFVEERGEMGPQASTVHVVGRHHVVG
jgi:ribosomal subunit interface protein